MSITTTEHDAHGHDDEHGHGPAVPGAENPGGEHETAFKRDQKERLMMWLFISGDALFLILELFAWFYLRALNVNGLWNGAQCSKANPCTDGLAILCAAFVWLAESAAKRQAGKRAVAGAAGVALLFLLGAIAWQIYQFQVLPFTTIDGAYASTFEFFIGSTLAHLVLLLFIVLGLWVRASKGRYEGGTWYRVRLIRFFAVWIAVSTLILALVSTLFY